MCASERADRKGQRVGGGRSSVRQAAGAVSVSLVPRGWSGSMPQLLQRLVCRSPLAATSAPAWLLARCSGITNATLRLAPELPLPAMAATDMVISMATASMAAAFIGWTVFALRTPEE